MAARIWVTSQKEFEIFASKLKAQLNSGVPAPIAYRVGYETNEDELEPRKYVYQLDELTGVANRSQQNSHRFEYGGYTQSNIASSQFTEFWATKRQSVSDEYERSVSGADHTADKFSELGIFSDGSDEGALAGPVRGSLTYAALVQAIGNYGTEDTTGWVLATNSFIAWGLENFPDTKEADYRNVMNNLSPKGQFEWLVKFRREGDPLPGAGEDLDGNQPWVNNQDNWKKFWGQYGRDLIQQVILENPSALSSFIPGAAAGAEIAARQLSTPAALRKAAQATTPDEPPPPEPEALTDEELKEKMWIVEQCGLLSVVPLLEKDYRRLLIRDTLVNKLAPHRGRIVPIKMQDPTLMINKFTSPQRIYDYFNIPVDTITKMTIVSHLSLMRENLDNKGGRVTTERVIFGSSQKKLLFAEGSGMPVRMEESSEIRYLGANVELNGTNPATARNDIKVKLKFELNDLNELTTPLVYGQFPVEANDDGTPSMRINKEFIDDQGRPTGDYDPNAGHFTLAEFLMHPAFMKNSKGTGRYYKRQFHPSYGRLRLHAYPSWPEEELNKEGLAPDYKDLLEQVSRAGLSLDLTLVDHTIERDAQSGIVSLSIDYRGYMDTVLSMPFMDALATDKILQARQERERIIERAFEEGCTAVEIQKIQRSYQKLMKREVVGARTSIMQRMIDRKKIHEVEMDYSGLKDIFEFGATDRPEELMFSAFGGPLYAGGQGSIVGEPTVTVTELEKPINTNWITGAPAYGPPNSPTGKTRKVRFFFLGDLLEIITDLIFDRGTQWQLAEGIAIDSYREDFKHLKPKIVTGAFNYNWHTRASVEEHQINIAAIPIATSWFMRWFNEEITTKELDFVPIGTLIRMICEEVLNNLLAEECFNTSFEKKLLIRTSFFTSTAVAHNSEQNKSNKKKFAAAADPVFENGFDILTSEWTKQLSAQGSNVDEPYLNIDKITDDGLQPIFTYRLMNDPNNPGVSRFAKGTETTNYIVVHASGHNYLVKDLDGSDFANRNNQVPTVSQTIMPETQKQILFNQIRTKARARGASMVQIERELQKADPNFYSLRETAQGWDRTGENSAVILSLGFSKTDSKYLRESRFYNASISHLTLLGNVYDCTFETNGSYFLYPGMLIYVNPGLTGVADDTGQQRGSLANQIGMAGYYIIYKVSHEIKPTNKTITTVEAKWHHSGFPDEFRFVDQAKLGGIEKVQNDYTRDACTRLFEGSVAITPSMEAAEVRQKIDELFSDPILSSPPDPVTMLNSIGNMGVSGLQRYRKVDKEWLAQQMKANEFPHMWQATSAGGSILLQTRDGRAIGTSPGIHIRRQTVDSGLEGEGTVYYSVHATEPGADGSYIIGYYNRTETGRAQDIVWTPNPGFFPRS